MIVFYYRDGSATGKAESPNADLVRVPIALLGKSLVEAIIEVLVMREDDMAADIEQLGKRSIHE
jgi:hypothetical protein